MRIQNPQTIHRLHEVSYLPVHFDAIIAKKRKVLAIFGTI